MTPSSHAPAPPKDAGRRSGWLAELLDTLRVIGGGLLLATVFRIVCYQPFTIPSSSMEPGLLTGDYILVSKFAYGWSRASLPLNPPIGEGRLFGRDPDRGDVVVFRRPSEPETPWIKRVIGLPGDRVQVSDGVVWINGAPLQTTPLNLTWDSDAPTRRVLEVRERIGDHAWITYDGGAGAPGDDTPVYIVPQGAYFVMGDNRDNSLDSRFPAEVGVGFLPAGNLMGRAEVIAVSWRPGASLLRPWTWANLRPDRAWRPIA